MIWLELAVILVCMLFGALLSEISLGTIASIGLEFVVFVFGRTGATHIGKYVLNPGFMLLSMVYLKWYLVILSLGLPCCS